MTIINEINQINTIISVFSIITCIIDWGRDVKGCIFVMKVWILGFTFYLFEIG